jgi:hypothetical protein
MLLNNQLHQKDCTDHTTEIMERTIEDMLI